MLGTEVRIKKMAIIIIAIIIIIIIGYIHNTAFLILKNLLKYRDKFPLVQAKKLSLGAKKTFLVSHS